VLAKVATGAAPPATVSVAGAWLGKSLGVLLLTAGAGAFVYNYNADAPPPAATASPPNTATSDRELAAPPQPPAASAPEPTEPRVQPQPARVEAPSTPSAPPAAKRGPVAAPRTKTPPTHAGIAQPPAAAQPTAAVACSDAVAEVDLLSRAQQALRTQPQLALTLLNDHARRFSCGVLSLERDTLRIDAERALGLDAQASEHARELVTRYPQSPETRALKQKFDAAANSSNEHKTQPVGTPTP
jgi:hypothetical protein